MRILKAYNDGNRIGSQLSYGTVFHFVSPLLLIPNRNHELVSTNLDVHNQTPRSLFRKKRDKKFTDYLSSDRATAHGEQSNKHLCYLYTQAQNEIIHNEKWHKQECQYAEHDYNLWRLAPMLSFVCGSDALRPLLIILYSSYLAIIHFGACS